MPKCHGSGSARWWVPVPRTGGSHLRAVRTRVPPALLRNRLRSGAQHPSRQGPPDPAVEPLAGLQDKILAPHHDFGGSHRTCSADETAPSDEEKWVLSDMSGFDGAKPSEFPGRGAIASEGAGPSAPPCPGATRPRGGRGSAALPGLEPRPPEAGRQLSAAAPMQRRPPKMGEGARRTCARR